MRNETTIEQTRALAAAGIDPSTASYCWVLPFEGDTLLREPMLVAARATDDALPCWTLADLLALLPVSVGLHQLRLLPSGGGRWLLEYRYMCGVASVLHDEMGTELVDMCAAMLVWLQENGHLGSPRMD